MTDVSTLTPCLLEQTGRRLPSGRRTCSIWTLTPCGVEDPQGCHVLSDFKAAQKAKAADKTPQLSKTRHRLR